MDKLKVDWFVGEGPLKEMGEYDLGGDYNGYVVVHKTHPWAGYHPDDLPVQAHGGWTYGRSNCQHPDCPPEYQNDEYMVFGWDTIHFGDSRAKWPFEAVEKELMRQCEEFLWAWIKFEKLGEI